MTEILSLSSLNPARFDRPDILKQLNAATRQLAELKGVAASMPNQDILISTLSLQEAKDSSEIENIVTTHDELWRSNYYINLPLYRILTGEAPPVAQKYPHRNR